MTRTEFHERNQALSRAMKIYVPHITRNITEAFELYKAVFNEHEHETFINNMTTRKSPIDGLVRPRCPECDANLMLAIINIPKGRKNRNGYKTLWQCPVCDYEKYSKKTINDWLKELKMEENTRKEQDAYPWGCWKTIQ